MSVKNLVHFLTSGLKEKIHYMDSEFVETIRFFQSMILRSQTLEMVGVSPQDILLLRTIAIMNNHYELFIL